MDIKRLNQLSLNNNETAFFICNELKSAQFFAGKVRDKLGKELKLIKIDSYEFCWIIDYPMYEYDEKLKKINFSHNPFSMPQGGMKSLLEKDPLEITMEEALILIEKRREYDKTKKRKKK